MKKTAISILMLLVLVLGGTAAVCGTEKKAAAPLLPPGFEDSKVPNSSLDGYLYLDPGLPVYLKDNIETGVALYLSPTSENETLWLKTEEEIFSIDQNWEKDKSLAGVNDFVSFKTNYPDVWDLISRFPANPPDRIIGAGFLKVSDNLSSWIFELTGQDSLSRDFKEIFEKAKINQVAIGLYSKVNLASINLDDLKTSDISLLIIGKSGYPGLVISQMLSLAGLEEDLLDGEKVYRIDFGDFGLVLRNAGSYIYLSLAENSDNSDKLLAATFPKTTNVVSPAVKTTPVKPDPEQQLAEKFAPILYLHPDEVYEPKEVGILVNHAKVQRISTGETVNLRDYPKDQRMAKLGSLTDTDWYLDFAQFSLSDGADAYKNAYQNALANGYKTTVYARVVQESGKTILQYWFFYFFNDWYNIHEGDWEMIELIFDENNLETILNKDKNIVPESVAYSQHIEILGLAPGGTKANWQYVETEGNHPIVYVAKGSHANYFKPGKYLLNIQNIVKAGLIYALEDEKFADVTARRNDRSSKIILSRIIVLSTEPWLGFKGFWGEQAGWDSLNNGPKSPNQQEQWIYPKNWGETRKQDSDYWKSGFFIPH